MVKKKCIFLDRDGVINKSFVVNGKPFAPLKFSEFRFLPKVKIAIEQLKKKRFLIIIVTNQPDISRGKLRLEDFNKMTKKIFKILQVDDLFFCPHTQEINCGCRKPKIELFNKAIKKYNIDLKKSYMIGDRRSDIEAGELIKCKTIFIDRNYAEKKPFNYNYKCNNLLNALKYIN